MYASVLPAYPSFSLSLLLPLLGGGWVGGVVEGQAVPSFLPSPTLAPYHLPYLLLPLLLNLPPNLLQAFDSSSCITLPAYACLPAGGVVERAILITYFFLWLKPAFF